MVAEIISIGTEILMGNITNTNAVTLHASARRLASTVIIRMW